MTRRLVDQDRIREQRRQDRILLILERKFSRVFAAEIKRASNEMLAQFRATGATPTLPQDHEARIAGAFRAMATSSVEALGGRIVDQGKSLNLISERKDFSELFLRLAGEFVAAEAIRRKISAISETTREQIIRQIAAGRAEGLGVGPIAKMIASKVPSISWMRGAVIARTETHSAANFGADGAARSTGLDLMKEWVATSDERTRDSHMAADGQTREMDEAFDINGYSMMYAGDMNGPASEVINCRCSISHIVKGY